MMVASTTVRPASTSTGMRLRARAQPAGIGLLFAEQAGSGVPFVGDQDLCSTTRRDGRRVSSGRGRRAEATASAARRSVLPGGLRLREAVLPLLGLGADDARARPVTQTRMMSSS